MPCRDVSQVPAETATWPKDVFPNFRFDDHRGSGLERTFYVNDILRSHEQAADQSVACKDGSGPGNLAETAETADMSPHSFVPPCK